MVAVVVQSSESSTGMKAALAVASVVVLVVIIYVVYMLFILNPVDKAISAITDLQAKLTGKVATNDDWTSCAGKVSDADAYVVKNPSAVTAQWVAAKLTYAALLKLRSDAAAVAVGTAPGGTPTTVQPAPVVQVPAVVAPVTPAVVAPAVVAPVAPVVSTPAVVVSDLVGEFNADNRLKILVNGVEKYNGNSIEWSAKHKVTIPGLKSGDKVTFAVQNQGGPGGVVGKWTWNGHNYMMNTTTVTATDENGVSVDVVTPPTYPWLGGDLVSKTLSDWVWTRDNCAVCVRNFLWTVPAQ